MRITGAMVLVGLLVVVTGCSQGGLAAEDQALVASAQEAVRADELTDAADLASQLRADYPEDEEVDALVDMVAEACLLAAEEAESQDDLAFARLYYSHVLDLAPNSAASDDIEARVEFCQRTMAVRNLLKDAETDPQYEDKIRISTRILNEHPDSEEADRAVELIAETLLRQAKQMGIAVEHLQDCGDTKSDPNPLALVPFLDSGDSLRRTADALEGSRHPHASDLAQAARLMAETTDEGIRWDQVEYYHELGAIGDAAAVPYGQAIELLEASLLDMQRT